MKGVDFYPLFVPMMEDFCMNENMTANTPILALRGLTVFPEQTIHFDVGRVKSALALEYAMKHEQQLLLLLMRMDSP